MNIYQRLTTLLREWREGVSPPVFLSAAVINTALIAFAGLWTETAGRIFTEVLDFITKTFGAYYIFASAAILLFVCWLPLSRAGDIRLGREDEKPAYALFPWLSMLFAAGMGLGLVFWGVAEPLFHYQRPPLAAGSAGEAARQAMRFSFFHWGLHPWAVYVAFGLGIALLHFRHGLPLAPRSLLFPLFGRHIRGWLGHLTDAFCTVGTLLGVATSLGLGAMQINAGLSSLTGIEYMTEVQIRIIIIITLIATLSTVSGVSRGIKYLSITNVLLMLVLLIFVAVTGPTLKQLLAFFTGIRDYLINLPLTSIWVDRRPDSDWQARWTLFYWGWWFSWSPFVGIFIARISRGRTVREFVFYVLLIPSVFNCIWFAVFGGTALHLEQTSGGAFAGPIVDNVAMSLNILLEYLPLTEFTQWFGLVLVVIFFITSSDSGSFVDDIVTSGGNPNPPVANRVFWGISEGLAAAVLLLAGGLKALQAASLSAGLFQSLLLIFACLGLLKILRSDSIHNK